MKNATSISQKLFLAILFVGLQILCSCTNSHKKSTTNQTQKETLCTFYIYGSKAPVGYLDQDSSITYHYGFKLYRVADCEIESELKRQYWNYNNRQSLQKMNEKHGEQWQQKFEEETQLKLALQMN